MEIQKKYTLHVHNMHCASCVALTESELKGHPKVKIARSNLGTRTVEIVGGFGDMTLEAIAKELTTVLSRHKLSIERQQEEKRWNDFVYAAPIAGMVLILFAMLQKLGIVNLVNVADVSYGAAALIGVVASLSTCMAVVGGLTLSMSASFAKSGDNIRPQLFFHIGRLVAFFVLGGAIGALGAVVELSGNATIILSFAVGTILLVLGINLLDVAPWMRTLQPTLPHVIGKHIHGMKNINHALMPLALGAATFFLPCGFTQSMQAYSLTTGSFLMGAMTMFAFALGTLPVLAALSFGSLGITNNKTKSVFLKTAGLIVIAFAIMNIVGALVVAKLAPPILNF